MTGRVNVGEAWLKGVHATEVVRGCQGRFYQASHEAPDRQRFLRSLIGTSRCAAWVMGSDVMGNVARGWRGHIVGA